MSYTDDLVKKILDVKIGPPKIENFPKATTSDATDTLKYQQFPDTARDCLIAISNIVSILESENESLRKTLEQKIKIEDVDDVRKELRRTFDTVWGEFLGHETFPYVKGHFKTRLGL